MFQRLFQLGLLMDIGAHQVERYLRSKARKIASSGKLFFGAINERRKPPHWKNGKWCIKLYSGAEGLCQDSI